MNMVRTWMFHVLNQMSFINKKVDLNWFKKMQNRNAHG